MFGKRDERLYEKITVPIPCPVTPGNLSLSVSDVNGRHKDELCRDCLDTFGEWSMALPNCSGGEDNLGFKRSQHQPNIVYASGAERIHAVCPCCYNGRPMIWSNFTRVGNLEEKLRAENSSPTSDTSYRCAQKQLYAAVRLCTTFNETGELTKRGYQLVPNTNDCPDQKRRLRLAKAKHMRHGCHHSGSKTSTSENGNHDRTELFRPCILEPPTSSPAPDFHRSPTATEHPIWTHGRDGCTSTADMGFLPAAGFSQSRVTAANRNQNALPWRVKASQTRANTAAPKRKVHSGLHLLRSQARQRIAAALNARTRNRSAVIKESVEAVEKKRRLQTQLKIQEANMLWRTDVMGGQRKPVVDESSTHVTFARTATLRVILEERFTLFTRLFKFLRSLHCLKDSPPTSVESEPMIKEYQLRTFRT